MNTRKLHRTVRRFGWLAGVALAVSMAGPARAGSVYLTGHDIFLHSGQNGYDVVVLDFLRSEGSIARADYDIGFLTNGGVSNPTTRYAVAGFGSVTTASPTSFADGTAFATFLSGIDALLIPWRIDIGAAGSAAINSFAAQIADYFNAGGDIFAASNRCSDCGGSLFDANYYDFLPPGAAASGPNIPGDPSSGFVATAAGTGIGINQATMLNGFPTHNTFSSFASAFTVMEVYGGTTPNPVVSIGLTGGTITDGGITTGEVPEPGSLALIGLALAAAAGFRPRRGKKRTA